MDRNARDDVQRAMTALAAGDRSAFRPVFVALWPLVQRFCERTLRDRDRGQDAAQAAMMKLLLNASDFDPARDAISWALGFAAFECLSARNRSVRSREQSDEEVLMKAETAEPDPEHAVIARDLRDAASAALAHLRPSDLAVLEAAFHGQGPPGSTGTAAAFRKRLQRALERLRVIWRHMHGTE